MDPAEAMTASYLYPELFNVATTSQMSRPHRNNTYTRGTNASSNRPVTSSSTTTVSSCSTAITIRQEQGSRREYWTLRRSVVMVLILCLMLTFSLLIGLSLQYYEIVLKLEGGDAATSTTLDSSIMTMHSTTTTSTTQEPEFQKIDVLLNAEKSNEIPK